MNTTAIGLLGIPLLIGIVLLLTFYDNLKDWMRHGTHKRKHSHGI